MDNKRKQIFYDMITKILCHNCEIFYANRLLAYFVLKFNIGTMYMFDKVDYRGE